MLTGVSFKLKDKRVDKILALNNFDKAEIYYSPISSWIFVLTLFILSSGIFLLDTWIWKYWYLIILYLIISYLINAFVNNSFALYEDKLFIINPNFPFRQFKIINKEDVKLITIDKNKRQWLAIFMAFTGNYLSIKSSNEIYKFHCDGLELDCFDENWTEKTLDDLHYRLKQNGFPTILNIQD